MSPAETQQIKHVFILRKKLCLNTSLYWGQHSDSTCLYIEDKTLSQHVFIFRTTPWLNMSLYWGQHSDSTCLYIEDNTLTQHVFILRTTLWLNMSIYCGRNPFHISTLGISLTEWSRANLCLFDGPRNCQVQGKYSTQLPTCSWLRLFLLNSLSAPSALTFLHWEPMNEFPPGVLPASTDKVKLPNKISKSDLRWKFWV